MAADKGRQAWVNLSYMGISKGHPVKRGKDVMKEFMESVRLKTDPTKYDKMFGFGFNSPSAIFQTRGFSTERDMSCYLLKSRIDEIEKLFKRVV